MNQKANYAPGPWHYQEPTDEYTYVVRDNDDRFVAQLSQDETDKANAILISAAPDLLRACKATLVFLSGGMFDRAEWYRLTSVYDKSGNRTMETEATTRALCDLIRAIVNKAEA